MNYLFPPAIPKSPAQNLDQISVDLEGLVNAKIAKPAANNQASP